MDTVARHGVPRVLFVDDDVQVLRAMESNLGLDYGVSTAVGGAQALEVLRDEGPFAVVISDMRMPKMNGAELLRRVREVAPQTIRILLTGYSEVETAIAAINDGQIFRFLTKPCPPDALQAAVGDAVSIYRHGELERDLLENTVKGAVEALIEILNLATPLAARRTATIQDVVGHLVRELNLSNGWKYELAAMVSQVGCVTLPGETIEKLYAGQEFSDLERSMFDAHPGIAADLVQKVPRLEAAAEMIRRQHEVPPTQLPSPISTEDDEIRVGATMLYLAGEIDRLLTRGAGQLELVSRLRGPDSMLRALRTFRRSAPTELVKAVTVDDLQSCMTLADNVHLRTGALAVAKGNKLTRAVIQRLRNLDQRSGIAQPIRVRIIQ